ncbi:PREDICTED: APC membrane recruitment protein 2 [Gekko japonicus]|uniref:APC membrane recruitment protein 2 n=1 Tax=Gekko japonicus TaxID=146911 RepID=A0ABM1KMB2_GEKJA|nr:PREDICTED: APC membrane recruitment protein 2 [Gekko japonicus]
MAAHCDCGEPTTAVGEPPQPSGKLNRTAFKLFKRRKSGGAMPSIFGVRGGKGKSGEGGGGGGGQAGMVRSKTHDGLAEAVLESGKKEEPGGGGGGGGGGRDEQRGDGAKESSSSSTSSSSAAAAAAVAVGKSHSFLSLLRKNGGKGERPKGRGGLKGLFSSMRWPRRESKPGGGGGAREDEAGESSENSQPSPSLLMPGSLTASLECIKEEAPRPLAEAPPSSPDLAGGDKPLPAQTTEATAAAQEEEPQAPLHSPPGEEPPGIQAKERHPPPPPESEGQETKEDSAALTGCGDIIADQEDDARSGGGGSDKSAAGVGKPGASKKPPSVVAYQGGGEEMASPEQVGDTCASEFWDTLSQSEEKSQETPAGTESLEASKDGRKVQDGSASEKHIGVNQVPAHHKDQKSREKEQQEAVPSSDEGYWDSTTPGPEEDNANSIQKEVIPRDSYSGDALYDLYTDPDENTAAVTSADVTSVSCCKPLSPVTSTCPVKTHTTSLKDSKIPISIKHFTSPHGSHGPDASNSHHTAHHQPTKSEIPRTKIPVSKVLVHRASYRSLAGTTGKTATYHESAKK